MMSLLQVLRTVRAVKTEMGQPVHCCILMSLKVSTKSADNGTKTRGDRSTDRYRQVRTAETPDISTLKGQVELRM